MNVFKDEYQEASFIVDNIQKLISSGVGAGDICVLSKQESPKYSEILREALTTSKINNLEMSELQDVLKEPLGKLFSLFLKALVSPTPKVMTELFGINLALNKVEAGDDKEEELTSFIVHFIALKQSQLTAETTVDELLFYIQSFIHTLGIQKIKGRWKQYKSPEYYKSIWQVLEIHLRKMYAQAGSLVDATKLFDAENAVQVMNIHKCKGLEYHAVYFIGLEDQAFWTYAKEPFENNCAIYVALSRAKNQLSVTYCMSRAHRVNSRHDNRTSSCKNIKPIIALLVQKCKFIYINHK